MFWALDGNHLEVVNVLLEKDPAGVGDVLMNGVREGKPALVKLRFSHRKRESRNSYAGARYCDRG